MWLTASVLGKGDLKPWNQVKINDNGWKEKHLNNIKSFYQKTPYFKNYYPLIEHIYKQKHEFLVNFNLDLIICFLGFLEHTPNIILSSSVWGGRNLKGLNKILYILKNQKANEYISGDGEGSKRYIDEQLFKNNNIKLTWQNYKHPSYSQLYGDFISHLSILDLLFNEGPKSKDIILCK